MSGTGEPFETCKIITYAAYSTVRLNPKHPAEVREATAMLQSELVKLSEGEL